MPMLWRYIAAFLVGTTLLFATACGAQSKGERDDPSVAQPCPECGVIFEIREVRHERESARNLPLDSGSLGWTFRFTPGDRGDPHPHVDLVGSRAMRESMIEKSYEVVVRFNDNRWQRIEMSDTTGLKVGDRIHVHQNRIEPDDRDLP
jgi:hypothetical protein